MKFLICVCVAWLIAATVQGDQSVLVRRGEPTPAEELPPGVAEAQAVADAHAAAQRQTETVRVMAQVRIPSVAAQVLPQPVAVVSVYEPARLYAPTARWGLFGRRIIVTPRWIPGYVVRPARVVGPYYYLR